MRSASVAASISTPRRVGKCGRRLARASRSGAHNSLTQRLEDRPASLDGCLWTADNESQLAGLRVLGGAEGRGVHHIDAATGELVGELACRHRVRRAHVDQHAPSGETTRKTLPSEANLAHLGY